MSELLKRFRKDAATLISLQGSVIKHYGWMVNEYGSALMAANFKGEPTKIKCELRFPREKNKKQSDEQKTPQVIVPVATAGGNQALSFSEARQAILEFIKAFRRKTFTRLDITTAIGKIHTIKQNHVSVILAREIEGIMVVRQVKVGRRLVNEYRRVPGKQLRIKP